MFSSYYISPDLNIRGRFSIISDVNTPRVPSFIHIEEVHIMGVSMGNDDMEYFQEVIIPKTRDSKWIFMCHTQDDQKRYEAISEQYGIINAHYECW